MKKEECYYMEQINLYRENLCFHITKVIVKFEEYIRNKDELAEQQNISFSDINSVFFKSEGYKSLAYEAARAELAVNDWDKAIIGSGYIANKARRAINKADNLVHYQQRLRFFEKLDNSDQLKRAESILYELYCTDDMESAFDNAVSFFGGYYDLIAFLFFLRDKDEYLPIHSSNFDKVLSFLHINFKTSRRCSWLNYQQFIGIVKQIRDMMASTLHCAKQPSLLDAHSMLWMMHLDDFQDWYNDNKELTNKQRQELEEKTNYVDEKPSRREVITHQYVRDEKVVRNVKKRDNGICQLCGNKAPFCDKNGEDYLEVHHIIWLSRDGVDSENNAVALCPNCHAKMHIVDDKADIERLMKKVINRHIS